MCIRDRLKAVGLHALADGDDDDVGGDANLVYAGVVGTGPARGIHDADDLGLSPQGHGVAVFIGLYPHRGLEGQKLRAFGHGALDSLRQRRHIRLAAAVDAGNPVSYTHLDVYKRQVQGADLALQTFTVDFKDLIQLN